MLSVYCQTTMIFGFGSGLHEQDIFNKHMSNHQFRYSTQTCLPINFTLIHNNHLITFTNLNFVVYQLGRVFALQQLAHKHCPPSVYIMTE